MIMSKRKKSAFKFFIKWAIKTVSKSSLKSLLLYLSELNSFQEIKFLDLINKIKNVFLDLSVKYTLHWFILIDEKFYKKSTKIIKKAEFNYKEFILQKKTSVMNYEQKKDLRIVKHSIRAKILQSTMKKTVSGPHIRASEKLCPNNRLWSWHWTESAQVLTLRNSSI